MAFSIRHAAEEPADYPALLAGRGLVYHDPRWIRGIAAFFRYRTHWIAARDGERLVGVLALAEVPALVGPRRLVSFPFSYAAGPLSVSVDAAQELLGAARNLAERRGVRRIEIKSIAEELPTPSQYQRRLRYSTYRVETAGGPDEVWRGCLDEGTRRSIRRAEKRGIAAERGVEPQHWAAMAHLAETTFHRHGVPAPPRSFFTRFCASLQSVGLADLLLARDAAGATLAGIVLWKTDRLWYYAHGASDPQRLDDRPNHAILWAALRGAAENGVPLDLGRAAPEQSGLVDFKRRWGGEPVALAYHYWPEARGINVGARDRGFLGWGARVWSTLPVGLARVGSHLYRYLG